MQTEYFLIRRRVLLALAALSLPRIAGAAAAEDIDAKRTGGPYVPTPQVVVDEMLRIGRVGAGDYLVDLGSGDGVIVLTAGTRFKRSEEHTSELQSRLHLVCRLLLEKKKNNKTWRQVIRHRIYPLCCRRRMHP